jgi:hypothetical protein
MTGQKSVVAVGLVAVFLSGYFLWWKHARKERDRGIVAAFLAAARQGQEAQPCAVAVERVAEVSQQGKTLTAPTCAARPDPDQAKQLSDGYEAIAKSCEVIVDEVSKFDVRNSAAATAVPNLSDLNDPELKRAAADARTAVAKRDQVTTAFLADWRTLSKASTSYAKRLNAGLGQGNKDACEGLARGPAAKSPTEILVSCTKSFDAQRAAVAVSLVGLESLARR